MGALRAHIPDAIAKIRLIGTRGDIGTDEILYDAALRNLQTLSEATQRLPDDVKLKHPAIPWESHAGILDHSTSGGRAG